MKGTYGLGVSTLDFDADGWTDIYVANDSSPSTLYRNKGDGGFEDIAIAAGCAFSMDGKNQAGMGVAVGDFDRSGTLDIFKTNFAGDTSTLYVNTGDGLCEDRTFASGVGINTRWLGWGAGFLDLDNDGWLDVFLANGHVYPEVWQIPGEASYKQRKVVYWNRAGGRLDDVSERLGPPIATPAAARGAAFGDFDNDGSVDVLVNNVNDPPDLYRLASKAGHHWLTLKLVGTRSNRSAIGARVRCLVPGGAAGGRGARRRQLHLAERPARPLRARRDDAGGGRAGALAERPRRALERHRRRPDPDAQGRQRHAGGVGARAMRAVLLVLLAVRPDRAARQNEIWRRRWPRPGRCVSQDRPQEAIAALQGQDASDPAVALVLGVAHYHAGDAVQVRSRCFSPQSTGSPPGSPERREAVQVLGLALYIAGRIAEAVPWLEATREWAGSQPGAAPGPRQPRTSRPGSPTRRARCWRTPSRWRPTRPPPTCSRPRS